MAIYLIDKIKQKNGGNFFLYDATDVEMADGRSVEEAITASGSSLTELQQSLQQAINAKPSINDAAASATTVYSSTKVDDLITTAKQDLKDDLLGGAGPAYDSLKELADLIVTNKDGITAVQQLAAGHVKFDGAQELTDAQKAQARGNIGAAAASDLAKKLDVTTAVNPAEEGGKVDISTIQSEGTYFVAAPTGRPSGSEMSPVYVRTQRVGDVLLQTIAGPDNGKVRTYARTGAVADGNVTWAGWNEVGATPDLSGYALKTDLATTDTKAQKGVDDAATAKTAADSAATAATAAQKTADDAKDAAATNATAIKNLGTLATKSKVSPSDLAEDFDLGTIA